VNAKDIPRLVSWISKNPHLPKQLPRKYRDNNPNETYQKTFFSIVPPRVLRGRITQAQEKSDPVISGQFWTPGTPQGKDAGALTDAERRRLLDLFESEKRRVQAVEKKRFQTLEKMRKQLEKPR
jgi:hypothetical protein